MSSELPPPAKSRPVYRNIGLSELMHYRLPLAGKISILHRISGAALFLMLPVLLAFLQMSLKSEAGYEAFRNLIWGNIFAKLFLLGLLYFFIHHFCAGIRHLLLDVHKGIELTASQRSAKVVVVVSVILTILAAVKLW